MNDLDQDNRSPAEGTETEPGPPPRRRSRRATGTAAADVAGGSAPPGRLPVASTPASAAGPAPGRPGRDAAGDVRAEQVRVELGAVARAEANEIVVDKGALGIVARADAVSLRMGSLGAAVARSVRIRQGFARTVVAGEATVEQSGVRTLVANRVTLGPRSLAGIVVARGVDGSGRAILDWRGALVLAAALVLLRLLGRRPRSRRTGA